MASTAFALGRTSTSSLGSGAHSVHAVRASVVFAAAQDAEGFSIGTAAAVAAFAVSPSERLLAVLHDGAGDAARLAVYGLESRACVKTIELDAAWLAAAAGAAAEAPSVQGVAFAGDEHVVLLTGAPAHTLLYCNWRTRAVVARFDVGAPVAAVSACPADARCVVVSGPGVLGTAKLVGEHPGATLAYADVAPAGWAPAPGETLAVHAWLPGAELAVGTSGGSVLVLSAGAFKLQTVVRPADYRVEADAGHADAAAGGAVTALHALRDGFAVANRGGFVYSCHVASASQSFQRTEGFSGGTAAPAEDGGRSYVVGRSLRAREPMALVGENELAAPRSSEIVFATRLSVSAADRTLMACFSDGQLGRFDLLEGGLATDGVNPFTPVAGGCHPGQLLSLSLCEHQPLAASVCTHSTVMLWNLATQECVQAKPFGVDVCAVAVHPSGLQLAVGLEDRLQFFHIMMGDLMCYKELPQKATSQIVYSHSGAFFALKQHASISVFNAFTFERLYCVTGQRCNIVTLAWSADDAVLVSADTGGAIFEWNAATGKRLNDETQEIHRGVRYSDVAVMPQDAGEMSPHSIIAVGTSAVAEGVLGHVREMHGGQMVAEIVVQGAGALSSVAVNPAGNQVIVGMASGDLRLYPYPLAPDAVATIVPAHSGAVCALGVNGSGQLALSASSDGSLIAHLLDADAAPNILWQQEQLSVGLARKSDIDARDSEIADLKAKLQQLAEDVAMKLHMARQQAANASRQVAQDLDAVKAQLSETEMGLTADLRNQQREADAARSQADVEHMEAAIELESAYREKLAAERARTQASRNDVEDQRTKFDETYEVKQVAHKRTVQVLQEEIHQTRGEHDVELSKAVDDRAMMQLAFDEHLRQMEEEYEQELLRLRDASQTDLAAEREATILVKGDNTVLRKKLQKLQGVVSTANALAAKHGGSISAMSEESAALKEQVNLLREEAGVRNRMIQTHEQSILSFKNSTRDLEKQRFVQEYQLVSAKADIEPRREELSQLKSRLAGLNNEMEGDVKRKMHLSRSVHEKQMRLEASLREVAELRMSVKQKSRIISLFSQDLARVVTSVDQTNWGPSVKALYRKYVLSADMATRGKQMQSQLDEHSLEWVQQRNFMEKRLNTYKSATKKTGTQARADSRQKLTENSQLLRECNDLRAQNRVLKMEKSKLESQGRYSAAGPAAGGAARRPRTVSAMGARAKRPGSSASSAGQSAVWTEMDPDRTVLGLEELSGIDGEMQKTF